MRKINDMMQKQKKIESDKQHYIKIIEYYNKLKIEKEQNDIMT